MGACYTSGMMRASPKIAPSILAADFTRLGEQIAAAEKAGVDQIHIDVMDGHFVPNISIGPVVVEAVRRATRLPLDVHLMISEPDRYLKAFAEAGAAALTVHLEACPAIQKTLERIHQLGLKAGVAIKPGTPIDALIEAGRDADIWLVMTVEPGFGGQAFMAESLPRVGQARQWLDKARSNIELSVDGGIGPDTAGKAAQAGANVLVAGNAIFKAPGGISAAIDAIRQAASLP